MIIGELLRKWRVMTEKSLRDVAKEIGIAHGTLSRTERGYPLDGTTMLKIINWLFRGERS